MQDNLTPEQRQSVAWDDVLIAHNLLADSVRQMLETSSGVHMLHWIGKVQQRHDELRTAQQKYWNALAGAE